MKNMRFHSRRTYEDAHQGKRELYWPRWYELRGAEGLDKDGNTVGRFPEPDVPYRQFERLDINLAGVDTEKLIRGRFSRN